MIKTLIASLLLFAAPMGQISGPHRKIFGAACTAPSATSRWTAYNAANVCSGGCSNGDAITNLKDIIGSNDATAVASTAFVYDGVNTVNSLVSLQGGVSLVPKQFLTTGIAQTGTITFYAVVKPGAACASTNNCVIVGSNSTNDAFTWDIGFSSGSAKQGTNLGYGPDIGKATSALSTSVFQTIAVEYTFSSGVSTFYNCSGGSCTSDGTITPSTPSYSGTTNEMGGANSGVAEYIGNIGEVGYFTSISSANRSQIAAWSQCKYGI